MISKSELLIKFYEDAFERYGEALQNDAATDWEDEVGIDVWEEFHDLDRRLKVKFYYEDEV